MNELTTTSSQPVIILGGGINGAALARELVLNDVPVVVVDKADIASGTTAYSSRLIHGGLRYLEYGEFSLVRESLEERRRLLGLAPQFVRPLELFIPVGRRGGGWLAAPMRFLRGRSSAKHRERGLWLIRAGLWMYDGYARDPGLPRHNVVRVGGPESLPIDPERYRWLCSYWDAQITYPERFVVALLDDARSLSVEKGVPFELLTYHEARLVEGHVEIHRTGAADSQPVARIEPAAIVNATGAWVDRTLGQLGAGSQRLIGGTKGSHFLTFNRSLHEALDGRAVYAEAEDGRPVFVLPLGDAVLVGTTDIPFEGDPSEAVASDQEVDYLLEVVQRLMPQVRLTRDDIHMHYAGIRPLPYCDESIPGAITRRHWMEEHTDCHVPLYSIIGGKLTTCRSLAQNAVHTILSRLGETPLTDSRDRFIPGGEAYPSSAEELAAEWDHLAQQSGLPRSSVQAIWSLYGTRCRTLLPSLGDASQKCIADTDLPVAMARWVIRHEWVNRLEDLVERRLMLLYQRQLSVECLGELAQLLVEAGKLAVSDVDAHVAATIDRLQRHFGIRF
ncbi:MAG: glycerol-3-phosphate dehydrogenase/oxidase [Planctomycetes bacterium]|nr:glycerol-3-phosphate dehydrogenase/oxidase [Planctomycetota bacterium]MBL7041914.1 glycerol-3-phosphate dehydrogenase/oxidase [Pirellulaceae bacterium]